jgi:intraflagellar transport protein 140
LHSPIRSFSWSTSPGNLAVVTDAATIILSETVLQKGLNGDLAVVQVSTTHVSINVGTADGWTENMRMMIRGIYVGKNAFVVWDGKSARICQINLQNNKVTLLEPFNTASKAIVITDCKDDTIFIADTDMIRIANFAGVQKGSITFSEAEGHPQHLHVNGKYLFAITTNRFIKVFDAQPNNPRPFGSAFRFGDPNPTSLQTESSLKVRCIKGNATGSRVAILADVVNGSLQLYQPDTRLHIFDRSKGAVLTHDFGNVSRYPLNVFWDDFDDRLLVCEAVRLQNASTAPIAKKSVAATEQNEEVKAVHDVEGENEFEVVLLFSSSEYGVLLQDSFPRTKPFGDLLGINVPNIIFRNAIAAITSNNASGNEASMTTHRDRERVRIFHKVMRDFVGINPVTDIVKGALLEFSFNLTLGKLDEAYKAVKAIDSTSIWENMAQMCVKTKRLDVAEVCLGNMSYARGAAALRESMKESNVDVSVGVLAIQLGLLDDAARCFREANRYDLLNNLYQAAGQWEKAINIAETKDRIHLKTTHFHYARYLESVGDISEAMTHYEDSQTFRTEIPRMLYTLGHIDKLEDYVHQSNDVTLLKWWAAYLESKERYDRACKYYSKAGDYLSLVRILCFQVSNI